MTHRFHPGGIIPRPDDALPRRLRRLPGERVITVAEIREHGPALLAHLQNALPTPDPEDHSV